MKHLYLALCFFCTHAFSYDLSGCWSYENKSSSYALSIQEKNNKITGNYCFINSNGNRIDCDKDASLIDGEVNNGLGIISFGGSGKGHLTYENGELILNMIDAKPFDDFNMHIPDVIKLSKIEACK